MLKQPVRLFHLLTRVPSPELLDVPVIGAAIIGHLANGQTFIQPLAVNTDECQQLLDTVADQYAEATELHATHQTTGTIQ